MTNLFGTLFMFKGIKLDKSFKHRIGVFLGTVGIVLSANSSYALAQDKSYDTTIKFEYVKDDDSVSDTYKLVAISDYEMHNSVITTADMFDYIFQSTYGNVIEINGIEFDKDKIYISYLEEESLINDDSIVRREHNHNLDVRYIYDEDHTGKHHNDSGSYKLITISDYQKHISITTTIDMFNHALENSKNGVVIINGIEFDKEMLDLTNDLALNDIDSSKIVLDEKGNSYLNVDYIYDENHRGKHGIDCGNYKLVALIDYENNNVVTVTIDMFNHAIEHTHGDSVVINNLEFPRSTLLKVKEEVDKQLEESENNKAISNVMIVVISLACSVLKSAMKTKKKRYY